MLSVSWKECTIPQAFCPENDNGGYLRTNRMAQRTCTVLTGSIFSQGVLSLHYKEDVNSISLPFLFVRIKICKCTWVSFSSTPLWNKQYPMLIPIMSSHPTLHWHVKSQESLTGVGIIIIERWNLLIKRTKDQRKILTGKWNIAPFTIFWYVVYRKRRTAALRLLFPILPPWTHDSLDTWPYQ